MRIRAPKALVALEIVQSLLRHFSARE
jgi:hypothetical protein